jgi:hypothetical protein
LAWWRWIFESAADGLAADVDATGDFFHGAAFVLVPSRGSRRGRRR